MEGIKCPQGCKLSILPEILEYYFSDENKSIETHFQIEGKRIEFALNVIRRD